MTTPLLDRMARAARIAADVFRNYEKMHRAKGTREGDTKANLNMYEAEILEELVAEYDATRPQPGIPPEGGKAMDAFLAGTKHARVAAAPSPAVAQCAPQGEAVRALVAKWRKRWKELMDADRVGAFEVDGLQNCADELEAALGRELAGQGRETTSASPATPPG